MIAESEIIYISLSRITVRKWRLSLWAVSSWSWNLRKYCHANAYFNSTSKCEFCRPVELKCLTINSTRGVTWCHLVLLGHLFHLRLASLRGGRYFIHFEMIRVVKLISRVLEKAHIHTKDAFLLPCPQFYLWLLTLFTEIYAYFWLLGWAHQSSL